MEPFCICASVGQDYRAGNSTGDSLSAEFVNECCNQTFGIRRVQPNIAMPWSRQTVFFCGIVFGRLHYLLRQLARCWIKVDHTTKDLASHPNVSWWRIALGFGLA